MEFLGCPLLHCPAKNFEYGKTLCSPIANKIRDEPIIDANAEENVAPKIPAIITGPTYAFSTMI